MISELPEKILEYIKINKQATVKEMVDFFGVTKQALFRHLPKMIANKQLAKIGKAPKVFYVMAEKEKNNESIIIDAKLKNIIEEKYLVVTAAGEKKTGWEGFLYWCEKINLDPLKTAGEYIETLKKYDNYKKEGLIDGLEKFKNTFTNQVYLNAVFYLDFYSIERFGKTKLGQLLLYGKQSGNKSLIKQVIIEIKPRIDYVLEKYSIDGVCFVPWTVKREVQFMRELENGLKLNLRKVAITKTSTEVTVPQKTLSKLEDRIENVSRTMVVTERGNFDTVLIIDDAVGSGATLNEIAKQIKGKGIAKKVIGLAITGSFKGFEVISEI